jgi:hypothetical protein
MGPRFVFIKRNGQIEVHDFPTLEEAQAFYYGFREMENRNRNGIKSYPNMNSIQWICCSMDDEYDKYNELGHVTIYSKLSTREWIKKDLDYFLDTADI